MSIVALKPCPICKKEDWKNIRDMIDHIDMHNMEDPEYEKSVHKEMERRKREPFKG
jgi:hypothetical protein